MSETLPGFNEEQLLAEQKRMYAENPHKEHYDQITEKIHALYEERKKYAPKGSAALNLMIMLTGGGPEEEIVGRMNNQQLCEAAIEEFGVKFTGLSEAIFDAMVDRLGYTYQGKEDE